MSRAGARSAPDRLAPSAASPIWLVAAQGRQCPPSSARTLLVDADKPTSRGIRIRPRRAAHPPAVRNRSRRRSASGAWRHLARTASGSSGSIRRNSSRSTWCVRLWYNASPVPRLRSSTVGGEVAVVRQRNRILSGGKSRRECSGVEDIARAGCRCRPGRVPRSAEGNHRRPRTIGIRDAPRPSPARCGSDVVLSAVSSLARRTHPPPSQSTTAGTCCPARSCFELRRRWAAPSALLAS